MLLHLLLVVATTIALSRAQAVAPDLGVAASYGVLASSTITSTGFTVITGDLGLYPGTSVTGFPPGTVSGNTDITNTAASNAKTAALAAFNNATNQACGSTPAGGLLGGLTLLPGVYCSASTFGLTGVLTLDANNNPDAVFLFNAGSALTTASASQVVLVNGTQACRVFWSLGSDGTLGSTSVMRGTIIASGAISAGTDAIVDGRLIALTAAITLIDNDVTVPQSCTNGCATVCSSNTQTSCIYDACVDLTCTASGFACVNDDGCMQTCACLGNTADVCIAPPPPPPTVRFVVRALQSRDSAIAL